jgi:hypothetical protein
MKIYPDYVLVPALSECFANYLRDLTNRHAADKLITALDANRLHLEHDLMKTHRDGGEGWVAAPESAGIWRGHRCWLGWYPPELNEISAGDLWFDPVEISLMITVPWPAAKRAELAALPAHFLNELTAFVGWMSVRQMAPWQAIGYSLLTDCDLQIDTAATPPDAAVAGVSPALACNIALCFGKEICDSVYWEAAHEAFSAEERADLWREDAPEHGGEENSGFWIVIERTKAMAGLAWNTFGTDTFPYLDEPFPAPGVRFRTAVSAQLGIIDPIDLDDGEPHTIVDRLSAAATGNG